MFKSKKKFKKFLEILTKNSNPKNAWENTPATTKINEGFLFEVQSIDENEGVFKIKPASAYKELNKVGGFYMKQLYLDEISKQNKKILSEIIPEDLLKYRKLHYYLIIKDGELVIRTKTSTKELIYEEHPIIEIGLLVNMLKSKNSNIKLIIQPFHIATSIEELIKHGLVNFIVYQKLLKTKEIKNNNEILSIFNIDIKNKNNIIFYNPHGDYFRNIGIGIRYIPEYSEEKINKIKNTYRENYVEELLLRQKKYNLVIYADGKEQTNFIFGKEKKEYFNDKEILEQINKLEQIFGKRFSVINKKIEKFILNKQNIIQQEKDNVQKLEI